MENIDGLKLEYEMILCGERKSFYAIGRNTTQSEVIAFLRYVFEDIVGWSPEQLCAFYTHEIAAKLHIERVIGKIVWPVELDRNKDRFYVAVYLYPDRITYNKKERIIQYYLEAYLPDDKRKIFFDPNLPRFYIENCAEYMIKQEFEDSESADIYGFFSKKKSEYMPMLKQYKLNAACGSNYPYCVDMIHRALPTEKKDDELYTFWRLMIWAKDNQIRIPSDRKKRKED